MKKHLSWLLGILLISSITIISWRTDNGNSHKVTAASNGFSAKELFEQYVSNLYQAAHLQQSGLELSVFQKAYTGFINLKMANKLPKGSTVLTVVDLSKPSREKRMWIVNVATKELLLNTWVAHGQGSGEGMANKFSNNNDSHQSSLGFYLTDDVYFGKHGRSLRLDGMDAGFNSSARARAIVVHAANYVSQQTINSQGRLGRSFGCPAVSPEVSDEVINTIKGKTVIFINGNDDNYTSKYLNEENVLANNFQADSAAQFNYSPASESLGK